MHLSNPTGRNRSRSRSIFGLAAWVLLCLAAGFTGALVSGPDAWYQRLNKPDWTPPAWVFGPVWTTLYILMGVAAWLAWSKEHAAKRSALALFLVQLALNAGWSWIFFGAHAIGWALVELLLLWAVLVATLFAFWRTSRLAAILLSPYLAWTTFAAALNGSIWALNR